MTELFFKDIFDGVSVLQMEEEESVRVKRRERAREKRGVEKKSTWLYGCEENLLCCM